MPVPDVDPGLHYRDRFVDLVDEIHCSVVRRVVDDDDVLRLGPGREERTQARSDDAYTVVGDDDDGAANREVLRFAHRGHRLGANCRRRRRG